jgi:hypothetical protein
MLLMLMIAEPADPVEEPSRLWYAPWPASNGTSAHRLLHGRLRREALNRQAGFRGEAP